MKLFSLAEVPKQFPNHTRSNLWTAVIPAAGRGSRLGYDKPKILYPVAGRAILDWLIDLLAPVCEKLVFIVSPHGVAHIAPHLEERLAGRFSMVIQPEPKGMADAIHYALPEVATKFCLIIWGDQAAIRPKSLEAVMKLQEFTPTARMTMPFVRRDDPYVHYQTDTSGRLVGVLEKREGAAMPKTGLSDCGLFAFRAADLKDMFQLEITQGITYSQATKEWNFLPMLPKFDTQTGAVCGVELTSFEETIGVNDTTDVARLETYLKPSAS